MCNAARGGLSFLLLTLLLFGGAQASFAEELERITRATRWQGEVTLTRSVQVERGAQLTIAAGTVVKASRPADKLLVLGRLRVEGRDGAPVRFATPQGWGGIEFFEAEAGSGIRYAEFSRAESAVSMIATSPEILNSAFRDNKVAVRLLRESSPRIEKNLFSGNEIGIDNEIRSAPTIRDNRFEKHTVSAIVASNSARGPIENNRFEGNKQGVGIVQPYGDALRGNLFRDNETALFCSQTKNSPRIENNRFEKNGQGVVNHSFAYPVVENNRFVDNGEAIRNDQFGSAQIMNNLIRGSKTAIYLNRKSNARIENNLVTGNELVLFVDYSSYPQVRNNRFEDNAMGVKLGIYQSADWEKRSGSKRLVQEQANARNSRNPLLAQAPESFNDFVDVSGNWWGGETARFEKAGSDANLPFFHDRRDQPKVSYPGFGDGSYALDVIRYAPWLTKPPANVGPEKK